MPLFFFYHETETYFGTIFLTMFIPNIFQNFEKTWRNSFCIKVDNFDKSVKF